MNKTGISEKELKEFDKTLFKSVVGIELDNFIKLYQEGIITIKENKDSLNNLIKEIGLKKTIEMFKIN